MDQMGNWNASHPKALKQKKNRRVCGLAADFSYDFFLHGHKCLHWFVSNRPMVVFIGSHQAKGFHSAVFISAVFIGSHQGKALIS